MTKPTLTYIAEKLRPLARPIKKLKHDPENARRHGRRNSDAIMASLKEHGQLKPVVISPDGTVIAGNGTMDAALALGWTHLAVVEYAGEARAARRYGVQDNRSAELAEWDDSVLAGLLSELRDDVGSLEGLGFTDAELNALIASDLDSKEITEDEIPDAPKVAVSKLGDVWTLGRHTLVCGSCIEADRFFAPKSAHLMVTDPPYGVSYVEKLEHLKSRGYGSNNHVPIENDNMSADELRQFLTEAFLAARKIVRPGAAYYVTTPQGGQPMLEFMLALRESGFPLRHMLVWAKNQFAFGQCDYHYQHEPILYGWVEGAAHHAVADRSESSLWMIDKPRKSELHPTMKPVELYARAIRNSTDPGDVVFEPFCGSGTAIIASEQLGRSCQAIELSPAYCDVIVERWQNFTGEKATRTSTE